ncbi:MAG: hypothetical protein R3A80_00025 [Bdellovibrionota bacterium]
MADDSGIKTGVFLVIFGGGWLLNSINKKRRARRFEDHQQIPVSSAPQGYVELSGFAWGEKVNINLDAKPAVFVHWYLEKLVKRGKSSTWEIVCEGQTSAGFHLIDETGAVWVNMFKYELDCQLKFVEWRNASDVAKATFLGWAKGMAPSDLSSSGGFFSSRYRVGVREILLGAPILAQGNFQSRELRQQRGVLRGFLAYREKYKKLKRNTAYMLSMMDIDNNGVLSEEEHRMGHVYSAQATARKLSVQETQQEVLDLFGELHSTEEHPLIVADTHEPYLLNRLKKWSTVGIFGGALLLAAGICIQAHEFFGSDF